MAENLNCYEKYSPDQERDERGRFGGGHTGTAAKESASARKLGGGHHADTAARAADRAVAAEKAGDKPGAMQAHGDAAVAHAAAAQAADTETVANAHARAANAHQVAYRNVNKVGRRLDANPAAHRSILY